jgi:hypothetical protein
MREIPEEALREFFSNELLTEQRRFDGEESELRAEFSMRQAKLRTRRVNTGIFQQSGNWLTVAAAALIISCGLSASGAAQRYADLPAVDWLASDRMESFNQQLKDSLPSPHEIAGMWSRRNIWAGKGYTDAIRARSGNPDRSEKTEE